MFPHKIIDTFWNEFKAFQNCTQPYHNMSRWASSDSVRKVILVAREVFSSVHSCVGICTVSCNIKTVRDRSSREELGRIEQIKDGVRSHPTEKRSVIYVTAKIPGGKDKPTSNGKVRCHQTRCNVWRQQTLICSSRNLVSIRVY
jgi:hypothetical protein